MQEVPDDSQRSTPLANNFLNDKPKDVVNTQKQVEEGQEETEKLPFKPPVKVAFQQHHRTTTSSSSSDQDEAKKTDSKLEAFNKRLLEENERLQELVASYQAQGRLPDTSERSVSHAPNLEDKGEDGESFSRLRGKIRSLKTKRKQEKLTIMQLQKNVEANHLEIQGLQRELNRSLTEIEDLQESRASEKLLIGKLNQELSERSQQLNEITNSESGKAKQIEHLETELRKRDNELEVTLELLQGKVERIIQLEFQIQNKTEEITQMQKRLDEFEQGWVQPAAHAVEVNSSLELLEYKAECKSLKRQNMMLRLVVEELQEARRRRSDSDIDIDTVFMKLPKDVFGEATPMSVGLSGISLSAVSQLEDPTLASDPGPSDNVQFTT